MSRGEAAAKITGLLSKRFTLWLLSQLVVSHPSRHWQGAASG